MKPFAISLTAAALIAAGTVDAANIQLTSCRGSFCRPSSDVDGIPAFPGGPSYPEILLRPFTADVNIEVFDLDGSEAVGDRFDFAFSILDFFEVGSLSSIHVAPQVVATGLGSNPSHDAIEYSWVFDGTEGSGFVLATLRFHKGWFHSDNEFADVGLATTGTTGSTFGVWNPVLQEAVGNVGYDAQVIPLPAGFLVLGGALAGLGVLHRRPHKRG